MSKPPFSTLVGQLPYAPQESIIDSYSYTGDILSFKRCSWQYGTFSHFRFTKALPIQAWFGDVIHMSIELLFRQFTGDIFDSTGKLAKGKLPTDEDVVYHCKECIAILKSKGMYARLSDHNSAKELLKTFNSREGVSFYSRIAASEVRLESIRHPENGKPPYVINGVVDVLIAPDQKSLEIWDYKAMDKPDNGTQEGKQKLRELEDQMFTYFEIVQSLFPSKQISQAVLYFVNELKPGGSANPEHRIDLADTSIIKKIKASKIEADKTVEEIRSCKSKGVFEFPKKGTVDTKTCDACEWRWSCPSTTKIYKINAP